MATVASSPARRRSWHPVTVAGILMVAACLVAAFGAAGAASAAGGPAWPVLAVWLLMGAASGFATSGST
jgi:hypothetical protein